jgi:hypothetical protein
VQQTELRAEIDKLQDENQKATSGASTDDGENDIPDWSIARPSGAINTLHLIGEMRLTDNEDLYNDSRVCYMFLPVSTLTNISHISVLSSACSECLESSIGTKLGLSRIQRSSETH